MKVIATLFPCLPPLEKPRPAAGPCCKLCEALRRHTYHRLRAYILLEGGLVMLVPRS